MENQSQKLFLSSIAFDITYKCNYRCRHCYNSSGEHELACSEMSEEEFLKVAEDIAKISPSQVCICGGEPLIKKDLLCKIAKTIRQNPNIIVNTVTNGYLMTPEIARELKEAGFYSVQVSLDGSTKETHEWLRNHEDAFERAKNAIKYIHDAGLSPGVACCPTKRNLDEILDVAELAFQLGSDNFRVQPIMSLGRAKGIEDFFPTTIDYMKLTRKIQKLRVESSSLGRFVEWGDPIAHIYSMKNNLPLETVIVNAYGEILISPYIPISFGNTTRHPLSEYLRHGFANIPQIKLVNKIINLIQSPEQMDLHKTNSKLPALYESEFIKIDLIEDDVTSKSESYIKNLGI